MEGDPHRVTLYLKLGKPATDSQDGHLQVEMDQDRWDRHKTHPMPWWVHLPPAHWVLFQG